jgi:preprotein translocase subunit SecA
MKLDDVAETIAEMRAEVLETMVAARIPEKAFHEQWQLKELGEDIRRLLNTDIPVEEWGSEEGIDETHLRERIEQAADSVMAAKAANFGPDLMRFIEKSLLIQTLDAVWKEHLHALDHLRQGIGLRAYGQRDPLNEYKSEAFALFNAMLDELKERVTMLLCRVELGADPPAAQAYDPVTVQYAEIHPQPESAFADAGAPMMGMTSDMPTQWMGDKTRSDLIDPNDMSTWKNAGRNAACPCGSGRKYKHCHGKLA